MSRIPAEHRRVLLVRAALRVIVKHGVAGATTRAIVAEAGMSLSSFHYAFRSHDEMMRELVGYVLDAESVAAFAVLRPQTDITTSLRAGLTAYLDHVIADPSQEQVLQELMLYALRTPGLDHLAREQHERYLATATEVLTEVAAAAGVSWSVPVGDVARALVTTTGGVARGWLADRDAAAAARVVDLAVASLAALTEPRPGGEPARAPSTPVAAAQTELP
jgi:AcrR family transcriptional regulator